MTSFVRAPNPVWSFVNLDGLQLDDTYYAHFLENTIPYIPQPVYQAPTATPPDDAPTPWANPLQFYANGTLPNNLYFEEGEVYRIEIRRGPLQSDPLIYLIQNFVAGEASSDDITIQTNNQITNPQFAFISFNSPLVIVNTGTNTYEIAPGWHLTLVGSATMTLTQQTYTGDDHIEGNPSFGLGMVVTSGTFDSVSLYQRFDEIPAIWAEEGISINFLGRSNDATRAVTVTYTPSDGTATTVISDVLTEGNYNIISGAVILPESDSTQDGDDGYVDIVWALPVTGSYDLSNIQVVGAATNIALPYEQTTVERQKDYLFHYYADELIIKPKQSILTGWSFSLNPYQFRSPTLATQVSQVSYIADQTILRQMSASCLDAGQVGAAERFGLKIRSVAGKTSNKFALIQYIDPATIRPYWGYILSSVVRAKMFKDAATTQEVRLKMRLIYRSDLPGTLSSTNPIASWTGTDPVYSAGWTELLPLNDPAYSIPSTFTSTEGASAYPAFSYDGFQMPTCAAADMTLGVVVYTIDDMDTTQTEKQSIVFDKISLVPNRFAVDANPQTWDQVLQECEYYYQKTFINGTIPAQNLGVNASALTYRTPLAGINATGAFWQFKNAMRASPTIITYSTSIANSKWYNGSAGAASGDATDNSISHKSVFITNAQVAGDSATDIMYIQASANAVLGNPTIP